MDFFPSVGVPFPCVLQGASSACLSSPVGTCPSEDLDLSASQNIRVRRPVFSEEVGVQVIVEPAWYLSLSFKPFFLSPIQRIDPPPIPSQPSCTKTSTCLGRSVPDWHVVRSWLLLDPTQLLWSRILIIYEKICVLGANKKNPITICFYIMYLKSGDRRIGTRFGLALLWPPPCCPLNPDIRGWIHPHPP